MCNCGSRGCPVPEGQICPWFDYCALSWGESLIHYRAEKKRIYTLKLYVFDHCMCTSIWCEYISVSLKHLTSTKITQIFHGERKLRTAVTSLLSTHTIIIPRNVHIYSPVYHVKVVALFDEGDFIKCFVPFLSYFPVSYSSYSCWLQY